MNKKNTKKDNVIDFPNKLSSIEKEIEAIVFAAAEPLDIETIESKISNKTNVEKILLKLQKKIMLLIFQINYPQLKKKLKQ